MKLLALAAGCVWLAGFCWGKAVLKNNEFSEFVVAISPDIPQDDTIITSIESMMRDASREMYIATRNRAYIKSVKILVPKTWNMPEAAAIENESFETAEYRIDNPNPCYGDSPYTVQTTDCGVPGSYTHLTTGYVKDGLQYGNKGKTLVHEFAKLRWGVFEEHGYPGDSKFPMYYMKAVWSPEGQKATVTPNFCVNGELRGYEQDRSDGGNCKPDESGSGLPDGNCIFYTTQDSAITSSYMSLPYLTTNVNFCDNTEELYHDTQLPTKQNLYCNGKSTWEVILESPDFNGEEANPPRPGITNTDPEFIIVGGSGETSSLNYVLVADISLSMAEKSRFIPMKNAAKRWITFDLQDDVNLGLVFFSDLVYPGFNLTAISAESRTEMSKVIDDVTAKGQTCIYCALYSAANNEGLLNNGSGVIILLTDGKQNVGPPLKEIIPILVAQNVRVITIALGDEADEEIEDLAEATGGKSFYVDDNSGPGDFNDAFSGCTTFQPGDTLGDTDVTIYQRDWIKGTETEFKDVFEVDTTLGRNLSFRLEFMKSKSELLDCGQSLHLIFQDADGNRNNDTFQCSKDNFGIYTKKFDGNSPSGRWLYIITSDEDFESMSIKITSKSSGDSVDPITTKCWINTGSQLIGEEIQLKLSAMAEVKQGNMPVIGAKVKAYIERPQDSGEPLPALELELLDNGAGADSIQNDGIYTRYFTKYTGTGRYSVKCEVSGGDDTQINEGFIVERNSRQKRSIPELPISTPMCCGSNTVRPDSILKKTGNFSRQSAGGSFQMAEDVAVGDMYPPSRITDLKVPNPKGDLILEFTSPGDDLDSEDPVKDYTIRYALTSANLTDNFASNENMQIDASYLISGSLAPVAGGSLVRLQLSTTKFTQGANLYFFAMIATDEAGNMSPVSNVVSYCLDCEVTNPTTGNGSQPVTLLTSLMISLLALIKFIN